MGDAYEEYEEWQKEHYGDGTEARYSRMNPNDAFDEIVRAKKEVAPDLEVATKQYAIDSLLATLHQTYDFISDAKNELLKMNYGTTKSHLDFALGYIMASIKQIEED